MEIATSLPVHGSYKDRGERSRVLYLAPYDPLGKSLFGNVLGDRVCTDSIGHPLEGSLAAFPDVLVQARSPFGDPGSWAGTLLFTQ